MKQMKMMFYIPFIPNKRLESSLLFIDQTETQ